MFLAWYLQKLKKCYSQVVSVCSGLALLNRIEYAQLEVRYAIRDVTSRRTSRLNVGANNQFRSTGSCLRSLSAHFFVCTMEITCAPHQLSWYTFTIFELKWTASLQLDSQWLTVFVTCACTNTVKQANFMCNWNIIGPYCHWFNRVTLKEIIL